MLIKYYGLDGSLTIIDSISDVRVPKNPDIQAFENDLSWNTFTFDGPVDNSTKCDLRAITYADDGPCVLIVWGIAYICNDDGKTIERVVGPGCPLSEE